MKSRLLILNLLFFTLYCLFDLLGLLFFKGIITGFLILLLPGLGWTFLMLHRIKDLLVKWIFTVFISTLILIIGLFLFNLFKIELTRWNFIAYLFLVSNIGIIALRKQMVISVDKMWVVIFFTVMLIAGANARNMPLVEDMDIHFIIPNYGLIHELKPYKHISRPPYVFEHPTGPHFLSAGSMFLMGQLHEVEYCYRGGKAIEQNYERSTIWKHWDEFGPDVDTPEIKRLSLKKDLLFSVRIPHFFIAGFLMVILFEIIRRATSSAYFGLLGAMLFFNPESVVRFSYAEYHIPELFVLLSMAYMFIYSNSFLLGAFFVSFFAAWINQKTIILPLAIIATDLFRFKGKLNMRSLIYLIGFVSGLAVFTLYGAFLNWNCLLHSFFIDHGVVGLFKYHDIPGFFAAWTRAILYINPVIFLICIIAFTQSIAKNLKSEFLVIHAWLLVGFAIFITCRWPILYNCYHVYPALFILLAYYLHEQKPRSVKVLLTSVVIGLHIFNFVLHYKTIARPNSFYMENECGNTPKTVLADYYDSIIKKSP